MRELKGLYFNWRMMGLNAYMPLITSMILLLIAWINKSEVKDTFPALEMIFPLMSAWWTIFVLEDMLSSEGREILLTYPVKRWQSGLMRVLLFYCLYMVLMIIMLLIMNSWMQLSTVFSLAILFGSQSLFYTSLAFLGLTITHNTGWTLVILTAYLSVSLLSSSISNSFSFLDVYLHIIHVPPYEVVAPFVSKIIILSIVCLVNAHYIFSRAKQL
ncbi:hypothetical protein [Paenibacillus aquistagni]|uniref:hypothetical protein n=1 Tax=Paenibacillus aquistagni TaxID=1852522 RepID=UPI00145B0699|nr:hypothetical protein [Paenibacillus aquistagni]NMM54837.1 hypothetical protein [Paenibacillus aquistagni]